MPWTLVYPLTTSEERIQFRREHELLYESPDVEFITELRRGSGVVEPDLDPPTDRTSTILIVRFVDELERTDDHGLLQIHERRRLRDEDPTPNRTPPIQDGPERVPTIQERIISDYISSPGGRTRLAASMAAPLRRRMDYQSVARRTFLVEELPQGALPIYDRDPDPGVMRTLTFGSPMDQGQTGDALAHARTTPLFTSPLRSGAGAQVIEAYGGRSRVDGLMGMTPDCVGHYLEVRGSTHAGNNGIFQIANYFSPTSVWVLSQFGALADYGVLTTWAEYVVPPESLGLQPMQGIHEPRPIDALGRALGHPDGRYSEIVADFEVFHGRSLQMSDIPSTVEARTGWVRVLDDSFLSDD